MLIRKLADGTFLVEVPMKYKSPVNLEMNEEALLANFNLTKVPDATRFDAEPRSLAEYVSIMMETTTS